MILTISLLLGMITLNQNKATVSKWCKRQVREFQLMVFKSHLLHLQQKYGPDGALET